MLLNFGKDLQTDQRVTYLCSRKLLYHSYSEDYLTALALMDIVRGAGKAHFLWICLFGVLITCGEICFSPLGNSFVSKFAPKKYLSLLMGIWTMAFSLLQQSMVKS